jgi:hypothetical protein
MNYQTKSTFRRCHKKSVANFKISIPSVFIPVHIIMTVAPDMNLVPVAAPTVYQTLVSVNNMDETQFRIGDEKVLAKYGPKVFQNNMVSEDIYNTIANRSGAPQANGWDLVS